MTRRIALIRHKILENVYKTYPEFTIYNPSYFSYQSNDSLYHLVCLGKEIVSCSYLKVIHSGFSYINYLYTYADGKEPVDVISMDGKIILRAKKILSCSSDAVSVFYIDMDGKVHDATLTYDVEHYTKFYQDTSSLATGMRTR